MAELRAPGLIAGARKALARALPSRWFAATPLDVASWNLFDIGVVDRRDTGMLDVFTANHNSRQSLLENDGSGAFRDVFGQLGLDQDLSFPGWVDDVTGPAADKAGLYLHRRGNAIVVRAVGLGGNDSIAGRIQLTSPVRELAPSPITAGCELDGNTGAIVWFNASTAGELEVRPELVGLPVVIHLDDDVALDRVFVGSSMATPTAHVFPLRLQDRHGMAWTRRRERAPLDLFVARGGLRGRLDHYRHLVADECFAAGPGTYRDVAGELRIGKGTCRSRQAAWVPIPGWPAPHLFVSCHGGPPQLHRPGPDGLHSDVAPDVGLGGVRGQHFFWIGGDGALRLVGVDGDRLTIHRYARDHDTFEVVQTVRLRGAAVRKVAVGDSNGDGLPELFAPSPDGNTLLYADGEGWQAVDPGSVGLPRSGGVAAAWVDFDNDGRLDLHVVPGGLYRQRSDGTFTPTRHLPSYTHTPVADARISWFDSSGRGARDALVATVATSKREGGGFDWSVVLHRNLGSTNHWLQVDLVGPPSNPHALGAEVRVRAGGMQLTQWVGGNEGSHFSQGHYRLYFGLGTATRADSLTVRWPDGTEDRRTGCAADHLIRLAHGHR